MRYDPNAEKRGLLWTLYVFGMFGAMTWATTRVLHWIDHHDDPPPEPEPIAYIIRSDELYKLPAGVRDTVMTGANEIPVYGPAGKSNAP